MRSEYRCSDFPKLERGKFYAEVAKGTTVVLLSPENAKVFPSSRAVNDALAGLRTISARTTRVSRRSPRARARVARPG